MEEEDADREVMAAEEAWDMGGGRCIGAVEAGLVWEDGGVSDHEVMKYEDKQDI